MERILCQRRSSCLLFQMLGVEAYSFLPDDQSDCRNLPRQGEASHRWLHPLGKQTLVKIVERPSGNGGHGSCTLEDIFEVVVVVRIQSTKLLRVLGTLQLSFDIAVLRAVVRLQPKTAVGPQLPLGTEPVRCLHQCHQLSGPNRTGTRDLAQQLGRVMLPTLE